MARLNPNDLSAPGKAISQSIANSAADVIRQIYTTPNGTRALIAQVSRFFALLLFGGGLVQWIVDGNEISDFRKTPLAIGTFIYIVLFSGGGYLYGQIYYGLYQIFDAIINSIDQYQQYYDLAAAGKTLNSAKAAISPVLEACKGMVGQAQAQCLSDNAPLAASILSELQQQNPSNPFLDFLTGQGQRLRDLSVAAGQGLMTGDIGKVFWSFIAPPVELVLTFVFSAMIVCWDVLFFLVFIVLGLGGPIFGLSCFVTGAYKSGIVVSTIGMVSLFLWRVIYWAGLGESSRIILQVNDPFSGLGSIVWGIIMGLLWPVLSGLVIAGCAKGVFAGIAGSAGSAISTATQLALMAGTGGAGTPAAAMAGKGNGSSSSTQVMPALPASSNGSNVKTEY